MARAVQPADLKLYRMISEPSLSPDCRFAAVSFRRANVDEDVYESDVYVVRVDGSGSQRFTTGGRDEDPVWSPDGSQLLFVSKRGFDKEEKGNALYVMGASGGEARMVLRSKGGIESPDWSPDSKSIVYLGGVLDEAKDDVRVVKRIGLWFNGVGFTYNRRKHLFVVDPKRGEPKQITKGEFDVTAFALSHDGRRVAYLGVSDDLKPYIADLFVMNLNTGATQKLTSSNMELSAVTWSPDDRQLALTGDDLPSGFASHEMIWVATLEPPSLKKVDGVDRNKVNSLNSDVRTKAHAPQHILWDRDGIYFVQQDGGAAHLYRMKPGKKPELVVGGDRSVEGYDVVDRKVVFVSSDPTHLPELYLNGRKDTALTVLGKEVYQELKFAAPRGFSFKASDGEAVEGWVMLPEGSAGPLPVILYVHGGPKTSFGHAFFHEFQTFVGAGYAVVFLNPRGSDGYSEKFADIRGKYGTRDFQDLMEGLDQAAKSFPQLDLGRAAIAGGSYGGFMANWAVGHTDRFKAAVSDRSISSWVSMWGVSDIGPHFTSDQIGGDPWSSEEKILADSPLRYVPNVKTPVLLVHSMEDYRCPMVEGIQFFTALKKFGKEAELVLFPEENHDLSRVGKPKHRVVRLDQYLRWFALHLSASERPAEPTQSSPPPAG
jgi:dipeptidyl aminopeptidase/acylaminoacyl peptidase